MGKHCVSFPSSPWEEIRGQSMVDWPTWDRVGSRRLSMPHFAINMRTGLSKPFLKESMRLCLVFFGSLKGKTGKGSHSYCSALQSPLHPWEQRVFQPCIPWCFFFFFFLIKRAILHSGKFFFRFEGRKAFRNVWIWFQWKVATKATVTATPCKHQTKTNEKLRQWHLVNSTLSRGIPLLIRIRSTLRLRGLNNSHSQLSVLIAAIIISAQQIPEKKRRKSVWKEQMEAASSFSFFTWETNFLLHLWKTLKVLWRHSSQNISSGLESQSISLNNFFQVFWFAHVILFMESEMRLLTLRLHTSTIIDFSCFPFHCQNQL